MGDFPHELTIEATYAPATARRIVTSLTVEAVDLDDDRSCTGIDRDGGDLSIEISARDLTSLRAACATWFGLLGTAEGAAAIGERGC